MFHTSRITPIETVRSLPAIRRMNESVPEREITFIAAGNPEPSRTRRRLSRSVTERFQAITNIGLSGEEDRGPPLQRHRFRGRDGRPDLSYLAAGGREGHRVLFVHGTPGEAVDWTPFLRNAPPGQQRIAIDRPGFGASGPGAPVVSLAEQAAAVAALLEAEDRPTTVVGSSYGGPVALTLAANHPETVSGVVLVGAAADPERERVHPVQRLAAMVPFRRLLPRALAHSNAELLALRRELEELARGIARISAPVSILQGLHDTLVPAENAEYIARRLTGSRRRRVILVDEAGHFLHILRAQLVETAVADVLSAAGAPGSRHGPTAG